MKKFLPLLIMAIFMMSTVCFANVSVNADSAILIEKSTGKIIYEKNIDKKQYPASITKILTALIVIEECELTDEVTVSSNAVLSVPAGASIAYLKAGEKFTVEQMLYALLVPSGNDAANVLAEHVSGSVEEFAKKMNERAKQLGAINSNFVNANGLHNENHYTTAKDMLLITQEATKYEIFNTICATTKYTMPSTDIFVQTGDNKRVYETTNMLLVDDTQNSNSKNHYYQYATGIKTGYTSQAKNTLVASAKKDNMELICVLLNVSAGTNVSRYYDAKNLFEYGFTNYTLVPFTPPELPSIDIENSNDKLTVKVSNTANILTDKELSFDNLIPKITLKQGVQAPIQKDTIVGHVDYEIDGQIYSFDLIAQNDVNLKPTFLEIAWDIVLTIFKVLVYLVIAFIVLAVVIRIINKSNKKKRRSSGKRYK